MKYPNRMQAALLLDARFGGLDGIAHDLARIFEMKFGADFNTVEEKPGVFHRLFGGGDELMLTFEYVDGPPDQQVFAQAMASPITAQLCPDMGARVLRAQALILFEVSHGAMGGVEDDPKIAAMFQTLGVRQGATPEQFNRRLETLTLMTRVACDHVTPGAIHWTQSNQLFEPKAFDGLSQLGFPGPIAIHPNIFGADDQEAATPEQDVKAGIRTFGARHWLGREIYVAPTTLAWGASYQTILAFLTIATMEDGYIIPDDDIFGPEDGSEKWRVRHRAIGETPGDVSAEEGGTPLYELIPLRHDEGGFLDPDYAKNAQVICEAGGAIMGDYSAEELYGEQAPAIADARAMVEGVGGSLMVTALDERPQERGDGEEPLSPGPTPFGSGPDPIPPAPSGTAPAVPQAPQPQISQPGETSVTGAGLRARLFGTKR
ncbi:MAG: hypothetical protein AAF291_09300 [Pseudomonadota bacterium]